MSKPANPYLKSQQNLEKHLALHHDLAHRDIDVELAKAAHMARVMDFVFDALSLTSYEQDITCPLCGKCVLRHTKDPNAAGAFMSPCDDCTGMDQK